MRNEVQSNKATKMDDEVDLLFFRFIHRSKLNEERKKNTTRPRHLRYQIFLLFFVLVLYQQLLTTT